MKILLDEHISPVVAREAGNLAPGTEIVSILNWKSGQFRNCPDAGILRAARAEGFVLVTFDVNTIPPVLSDFARAGESHAGVVFVSSKSFAQNDIGALARALARLVARHGGSPWEDRTGFLENREQEKNS
jgi:predicted nuclease of predicted toxin-antitoxin system